MDISNVFIICGQGWNKPKVVKEIELEGYKHNFFFSQGQDWDVLEREIKKASEVWVFGDATGYEMYNYAKKENFDIWQMA